MQESQQSSKVISGSNTQGDGANIQTIGKNLCVGEINKPVKKTQKPRNQSRSEQN
jgi:hypothetical protein